MKLVESILDLKSLEQKPTRDGFDLGQMRGIMLLCIIGQPIRKN